MNWYKMNGDFRTHQIIEQKEEFIEQLKLYSKKETSSKISALLCNPQYHLNAVRLETLQKLVVEFSNGNYSPSAGRISQWLNSDLAGTSADYDEDPPEDVFISTVISEKGTLMLFEGIWESSDYWVQSSFSCLTKLGRNHTWASEASKSVFNLLLLGDMVARKHGLLRYQESSHKYSNAISLPKKRELEMSSRNCIITDEDLSQLSIDRASLQAFIHDPSNNDTQPNLGRGYENWSG